VEFLQQDAYLDDPREDVRPYLPTSGIGSALDVGCGPGAFGRTLRSLFGPHAYIAGIDPVDRNVERARATGTFNHVFRGYFPDALREPPAARATSTYDLISFLDVLEHMFDPWSALEQSRRFLAPGGIVVAAIPNIQLWTVTRDLLRGRWDYTETGILDRTHVRFFTKATMVELFEETGFVVETCEGINSQLPKYWPPRRFLNRRIVVDAKWLPKLFPESQWLQYVIIARSARGPSHHELRQ
jgi:2-polyprenyl-3-methyl-5-hydroxy-6-metoxy-1,4-benzoquinol methylase